MFDLGLTLGLSKGIDKGLIPTKVPLVNLKQYINTPQHLLPNKTQPPH